MHVCRDFREKRWEKILLLKYTVYIILIFLQYNFFKINRLNIIFYLYHFNICNKNSLNRLMHSLLNYKSTLLKKYNII